LRGIFALPDNRLASDDPQAFAEALIAQVGRSRAGEQLDLDGRTFHARQLDGLLSALASGLQRSRPHG